MKNRPESATNITVENIFTTAQLREKISRGHITNTELKRLAGSNFLVNKDDKLTDPSTSMTNALIEFKVLNWLRSHDFTFEEADAGKDWILANNVEQLPKTLIAILNAAITSGNLEFHAMECSYNPYCLDKKIYLEVVTPCLDLKTENDSVCIKVNREIKSVFKLSESGYELVSMQCEDSTLLNMLSGTSFKTGVIDETSNYVGFDKVEVHPFHPKAVNIQEKLEDNFLNMVPQSFLLHANRFKIAIEKTTISKLITEDDYRELLSQTLNLIQANSSDNKTVSSRIEDYLLLSDFYRNCGKSKVANEMEHLAYTFAQHAVNNEMAKSSLHHDIKIASNHVSKQIDVAKIQQHASIPNLTRIIAKQADYLNDPDDTNTKSLLELTAKICQPSKMKPVAGGVLVLVGVTLCAASIGLAFATLGSSSPVSIFGLAAGTASIAAGLAITFGLATSGLFAFSGGLSFFKKPSKLPSTVDHLVAATSAQPIGLLDKDWSSPSTPTEFDGSDLNSGFKFV